MPAGKHRTKVTRKKKLRDGAEQLAAVFEKHFASLPDEERIARERAFDKTVAKIGSRAKSSKRSTPLAQSAPHQLLPA